MLSSYLLQFSGFFVNFSVISLFFFVVFFLYSAIDLVISVFELPSPAFYPSSSFIISFLFCILPASFFLYLNFHVLPSVCFLFILCFLSSILFHVIYSVITLKAVSCADPYSHIYTQFKPLLARNYVSLFSPSVQQRREVPALRVIIVCTYNN